jgi:biopolymer transport protein ExbD
MAGRRVRCPECDQLVEVVPLSVDATDSSPDSGWDDIPGLAELDDETETAEVPPEKGEDSPSGGGRLAVAAAEQGRGTVALVPPPGAPAGDTVMLEAVDVVGAPSDPLTDGYPAGAGVPPSGPPTRRRQAEDEPPAEEEPFRKTRLVETEMDMTPMVDVTFQMLIFFMITAAFALQKAKEIPRPQSDDPSTEQVEVDEEAQDRVTVKIDEYNTFLVINPDGDEDEAPSVQDLYIKLRRARTGGSSGKTPTKLRVEAHGDALHERVVAALDAGNDTGFAELELAGIPEDE